MKDMPVAKVELLNSGQIAVSPSFPDKTFDFIYRAGAGVEWKDTEALFLSPSQYMLSSRADVTPIQNINELAGALASELGLRLRVSPETIWVAVPEQIKVDIQREHGA